MFLPGITAIINLWLASITCNTQRDAFCQDQDFECIFIFFIIIISMVRN